MNTKELLKIGLIIIILSVIFHILHGIKIGYFVWGGDEDRGARA